MGRMLDALKRADWPTAEPPVPIPAVAAEDADPPAKRYHLSRSAALSAKSRPHPPSGSPTPCAPQRSRPP